MKTKIFKTFLILITSFIFFNHTAEVFAVENIIDVYYDNTLLQNNAAMITFSDIKPGDVITKDIKIDNVSSVPHLISVNCNEVENFKDLGQILEIVIQNNGTDIYGGTTGYKSMYDFCHDSDPFDLTTIPANGNTIYKFIFKFPSSAGNEYQKSKFVFNLIFDPGLGDEGHIVINEVYYFPDSTHGTDIQNCCGEVNAVISGNGANSRNIIKLKLQNQCFLVQQNTANIINNINANSNSGNNSSNNNTGGNTAIQTGFANIIARIRNTFNFNLAMGACASVDARNDEWVELYNPTPDDVSLKNWYLVDNSGNHTVIHANVIIPAGGFALLAKDAQTWTYWDENPNAIKIQLGQQIGNGLDNLGDHLYLFDPDDFTVDATAWGNDNSVWNPAVPLFISGHSMERTTPGFDHDVASDWIDQFPPSPGN
jgi:hypothetical protein